MFLRRFGNSYRVLCLQNRDQGPDPNVVRDQGPDPNVVSGSLIYQYAWSTHSSVRWSQCFSIVLRDCLPLVYLATDFSPQL